MKVTESAEKKLKEILAKENNDNVRVRILINGIG